MDGNDILAITLEGLEAGLKVSHIAAFDLKTRTPDAQASEVLADPEMKEFDQVPVRADGRIIGVLERRDGLEGSVTKNMRPLDDSILVSAEQALPKFLPILQSCAYRLVVSGPEINGIVTPSDIGKLPVRLMAFTIVAHLEIVMADEIKGKYPKDEDWLARLELEHQISLRGKLEDRRKRNLHLRLLDLTDFKDKVTIIGKLFGMPEAFQTELDQVKELRNSLDHARDYIEGKDGVHVFLERLRLAERWIKHFEKPSSADTKASA